MENKEFFSHSLGNTHIYQQLQVHATDTKCTSNKGLLINEIRHYEAKIEESEKAGSHGKAAGLFSIFIS